MSIWIPPIGTENNPFNGVFDGNGKVISGLRVTTNQNLNNSKLSASEFSNVGFFGTVSEEASISSFTLHDIYVDHSINVSGYSGIVAGEAPQNTIKYVGVYSARLGYQANVRSQSKFALIGNTEPHSKIVSDPGGSTPGGDGEGGDTGHFIPQIIRKKINPNIADNEVIDLGSYKMYVSDNDSNSKNTNNYWGLGCFSFVTESQKSELRSVNYSNKNLVSTKFRMATDSNNDNNYTVENTTLVDFSGSTTYAAESNEQKHINHIKDLDGNLITNLSHGLYFSKTPSDSDATVTVYNEANSSSSIGTAPNVKISNVKVNIVKPNSKIFIIVSQNNTSSRILGISKVSEAQTNFYFKEKFSLIDDSNYNKNNYTYSVVMTSATYTAHVAALVTIDEPGIYNLGSTSGGLSINYLSVEGVENGDSGGGTQNPESTVSYIDTVDFVDFGDIIDENYDSYSNVLFVAALEPSTSITILYFKREDDDDIKVYYGKNGNGSISNVNSTYKGIEFSNFEDYPLVNTN